MKRYFSCLLIIVVLLLMGCNDKSKNKNMIKPIYRTKQEWRQRFKLENYNENKKLDFIPNGRPNVKCVNGTFVGNTVAGVNVYKGIPYAQTPVGELRFQKAQPVLPSDDIFDASFFGKSFMQPITNEELASEYEIGEDCLRLNVWNNIENKNPSKPVLVFIHGGGFISGGTSDPLYDGWNFVHYNPEIIFVTITYRAGMLGFINLSTFPDGEAYKYATNNAFYDQIEALRWIKKNIEKFGGNPNNITICGESAGGCAVSALCVMNEAKGLFQKAIPMSGAVNLCTTVDNSIKLAETIRKDLKVNSVKELQQVPYMDIFNWWGKNYSTIFNHPVMDGHTLDRDLFEYYKNGDTKDLIILQGHTKEEFRYYYVAFNNCKSFYEAVCNEMVQYYKDNSIGDFDSLYERYKKEIIALGYLQEDVNKCFADDLSLAISNTYQAILHANAGGKGYSYTFSIPYDITFDDFELGAAHAVDCYFLFGNFDGVFSFGTNKEVDMSISFQKMIANFCKTGDPSTEDIKWPLYENEHRKKLIIESSAFTVVENPEKDRVNILLEMLNQMKFPYISGLSSILAKIFEKHPEYKDVL